MIKVYSKDALSIKALEKALKGDSRYAGDFVSSATWEGRAEVLGRVSISNRRPRDSGEGAWTGTVAAMY